MSATESSASNANNQQWHYELTPYVWAVGQDGKVGIAEGPGNGQQFEQSFSDIWDRMDMAGMAAFDARYDRWGILLDAIYLRVSDQATLSGPRGLVDISADGKVTQQQYAVAGYYRMLDSTTKIDAIAGFRYNIIHWDANSTLTSPLLPDVVLTPSTSERKGWVDPYVGIRVIHDFVNYKQWSVTGYADVGGSGSGSDLTWQVIGGVNYAFSPTLQGKLGYRYFSINYDHDGFVYDVATSGIYMGLGFTW
ncbi:MAG: outer membrane protein [Plesiomonas sp.]